MNARVEPDGVVTLVVRHHVSPREEFPYEAWLRKTIATARRYPGHLGIDVVRERNSSELAFTCVLRFASGDLLRDWLDSAERKALIAEVSPLLVRGDNTEVNDAREFWFTPAQSTSSPPPRWKQACVTFGVILPLSLGVPLLWQPLFTAVPWLGGYLMRNVLITLTIVLLVVYLFMPRVTAWCARWLNATSPTS